MYVNCKRIILYVFYVNFLRQLINDINKLRLHAIVLNVAVMFALVVVVILVVRARFRINLVLMLMMEFTVRFECTKRNIVCIILFFVFIIR